MKSRELLFSSPDRARTRSSRGHHRLAGKMPGGMPGAAASGAVWLVVAAMTCVLGAASPESAVGNVPGRAHTTGVPPNITQQPSNATGCQNGSVVLTVTADPSGGPFDYQWQRDGTPLTDDGIFISGATSNTLTLSGALSNATYDVVVTNLAGSTTSDPATLTVCIADFDCSGRITSQDWFDMVAAYVEQTPEGDINQNGLINSQDIFDFLVAFFDGC